MKIKWRIAVITAVTLVMFGWVLQWNIAAVSAEEAQKEYSVKRTSLPAFELPVPRSESEKTYLGLSGKGKFKVGQIKPGIVIIEIFSFYCPFCQRSAPLVDEVYRKIQERPDLKDKIRMIGIAAGNSDYEAKSFKEKYGLPFPVFPDEEMDIVILLGVRYTPTFIGVKVDGKGSQEQFYFLPNAFQDASQFLAEILKASGLE